MSALSWSACGTSDGKPADENAIALSDGTYARITSINGEINPAHGDAVDVHPGDVVTLSAGVIDVSGGKYAIRDDAATEDFAWSSDFDAADACDASDGTSGDDCIERGNFETTDYGVNYYVPYDMKASINLSLTHVNHRGDGRWSDRITLRNVVGIEVTTVVTDADSYPYPKLDSSLALAGHGRWVQIGGVRHFVPYVPSEGEGDDWAPFRNGSWAWVEGEGWTWTSNDPWGWYTDHYGAWRHHESYGWVWIEFDDGRYDPAPVTWTYDDQRIGWYPYREGYDRAYAHGRDFGFDDGYWAGNAFGDSYDSSRDRYGICFVAYGSFTASNVRDVRVTDRATIDRIYLDNYRSRRFGRYPGGPDREQSRRYIEARGVVIPFTTVRISVIGGRELRRPVRRFERPYSPIEPRGRGDDRLRRPIPIGSIIVSVDTNGRASWTRPTTGPHGITVPPRRRSRDGNWQPPVPPRTTTPAQPNPQLPRRRPSREPVTPLPPRPPRGDNPWPQPTRPQPQPTRTANPRPRPQPTLPANPGNPVNPGNPRRP